MKIRLPFLNRLSAKFSFGVLLILLLMLAGTLFVNSRLVTRYYVYRQREYVGRIGEELKAEIGGGVKPQEAIKTIEEKEKVLIVYARENADPEALSSELREAFRQKGLGFQKYWLWDQDYTTALQKGSRFRLYNQDKLNYSILVQYIVIDSSLYAVAAIVPNPEGFVGIINGFWAVLYSLSVLLAVLLIFIFTRHITTPLTEMRAFTRKLSSHAYEPLEIKTGDELEDVAESLNEMGRHIERYQKELESKNRQMKQLLSDVSHDLKTPISLVGMYASGMRDGLDDGTFLNTVVEQNSRMSRIVENLLCLSRIEEREYSLEEVELDGLLLQCIREQRILFKQRGLKLRQRIHRKAVLRGNGELLSQLFSNLLSNGAKYASGGTVEIDLYPEDQNYLFRIANEFDNAALDTQRIWEPFYTGQASRNKNLSGTGLGLPVVKRIAERCGYLARCRLENRRIIFEIIFPMT